MVRQKVNPVRRGVLAVLAFLGLLGAVFSPALAVAADPLPRQIFLAHGEPQDAAADPAAAMAASFRQRVQDASGGALRIEVFPDGQLGGNRDMARLVSRGVIQSAIVTVGAMARLYPPIIVTEMPFAFDTLAQAHAVFDGPFGRWLAADMAAHTGMVVLGFGDVGGFFVLTNSRREIRSPADLAGIKLRTIPGFPVLDAVIQGLGANPVKVSSREELQALSTRLIDGQINPSTITLSRRYDTVQSFATITNLLYAPYIWLFNRDAFATLSLAEQTLITTAAREAIEAGRTLSNTLDASGQGILGLERRLQVYRPTAEERKAFKTASQERVKAFISETMGSEGQALIESFVKAIEEAPGAEPAVPERALPPAPSEQKPHRTRKPASRDR